MYSLLDKTSISNEQYVLYKIDTLDSTYELKEVLQSCDLRVINFEIPLMPEPKLENVQFYQNDDAPAFLKDLGFDLFSMANNHAFDCGDEGFKKTIRYLDGKTFGSGTYNDAYKIKTVAIKNWKINFTVGVSPRER